MLARNKSPHSISIARVYLRAGFIVSPEAVAHLSARRTLHLPTSAQVLTPITWALQQQLSKLTKHLTQHPPPIDELSSRISR